jgi:ubiquinone/menaquinone biosynthesis C-methylase UbiE
VRSYLDGGSKDKKMLDIGCGTGGLPIGLYDDFDSI